MPLQTGELGWFPDAPAAVPPTQVFEFRCPKVVDAATLTKPDGSLRVLLIDRFLNEQTDIPLELVVVEDGASSRIVARPLERLEPAHPYWLLVLGGVKYTDGSSAGTDLAEFSCDEVQRGELDRQEIELAVTRASTPGTLWRDAYLEKKSRADRYPSGFTASRAWSTISPSSNRCTSTAALRAPAAASPMKATTSRRWPGSPWSTASGTPSGDAYAQRAIDLCDELARKLSFQEDARDFQRRESPWQPMVYGCIGVMKYLMGSAVLWHSTLWTDHQRVRWLEWLRTFAGHLRYWAGQWEARDGGTPNNIWTLTNATVA